MVVTGNAIREFSVNSQEIGVNLLIAVLIIVVGILLGKFFKLILGKIAYKVKLDKLFKYGSVDVALTIVKWSVYIFFVGIAVEQLGFSNLSNSFTNAISIIPKSIGAFIILVVGFAVGSFIQNTVKNTNKKDWNLLGNVSFYFFMYISFILSLQVLFTSDAFLSRWMSILFSFFYFLFLVLKYR
tara:strand:+ start:474 stop:1025 length:552 start_codon:yes stop_codon:yes gene_type:complete